MKKTVSVLLLIVVIVFVFFIFKEENNPLLIEEAHSPIIIEEEQEEEIYTLLFSGDIMLDRGVKHMVEKHGEDYTFPFLKIKDYLEADILFGNLESMISDRGRNIGSIYSFRADIASIEGLKYAGFDIVSLANNHTLDWDKPAFEQTMELLTENNILYTGAGFSEEEAHSPTVIKLGDTTIGFLGYTEFLYPYAFTKGDVSGVTLFNEENMKRDIEKAKEEVDFLIVTFHCGDEYQKEPNQKQRTWSESAIDYGADLIIGHHPHVTQPVEVYKEKYIAYSLGNFIFDQYFSEETMKGFLFEVKMQDGEIIEASKIHYRLNEFYQPEFIKKEEI